ncbi:MAG TPA: alpha/beta hydrolase [Gaiellaceae bacterium]|jgi:pimeloyl-ACP methyl ester carboxylesterase|nr:alpha/beta hydrolase [Gaiellaceae bacterium]
MKESVRRLVVAASAVLLAVGASHGPSAKGAALRTCARGAIAATINGKAICSKPGQKCRARFNRQYLRYGLQCVRSRLARSKPVLRRIDVGGYRLAIRCQGSGSPAVVLESGFDNGGIEWQFVQPKVAETTRVCSYDRAGVGASDARTPPNPPQAGRVVDELHTLLARAGVKAPYVLAGHSLGAFFIRLYAKRYPDQVVGLVTVDGTPVGLSPTDVDGTDLVKGQFESYYVAAANEELASSPSLGARPLIVLTRGRPDLSPDIEALWLQGQQRVAALSTDSELVRVDNADHDIPDENPAIIAEALREVVKAARTGALLHPCVATMLPRLRGTCLS